MADQQLVAMYLADDYIIHVGGAYYPRRIGYFEHTPSIGREHNVEDPHESLDICAGIYEKYASSSEVNSCILAVPGPFRTYDFNDGEYGLLGINPRLPLWSNFNVIAQFREAVTRRGAPPPPSIYLCSHAGAFGLGEHYQRYYADRPDRADNPLDMASFNRTNTLLYVSLDSGIGCSLVYHGELYRGAAAPAAGRIPMHSVGGFPADTSIGASPYTYAEQILSLDNLLEQWGLTPGQYRRLPDDAEPLRRIAYKAAEFVTTLALSYCPTQIVVGGRTAMHPAFLPLVRAHVQQWLKANTTDRLYPGYDAMQDVSTFIDTPNRRNSGVRGALYLLNIRQNGFDASHYKGVS